MKKLDGLKPCKVFDFFEDICSIPHGSGNMEKISEWCMDFAASRGLRAIKDGACNVVIFKDGPLGFEKSSPVILQGHLDMVCQKNVGCDIDFERDGLDLKVDGDYVSANGTTLGGDNGIGAAMILALLDSKDIPHPPIEAVFTTDEEIGMLGASVLDLSVLKGSKMINLDSENLDTVTVSCAGGQDVTIKIPLEREIKDGRVITITLDGLLGGHSGVEIDKNRINASYLLGRVLNHIRLETQFCLVSLEGGDKSNAITKRAAAQIFTDAPDSVTKSVAAYLETVKAELSACEPNFFFNVSVDEMTELSAINSETTDGIIRFLSGAVQGVVQMSSEIQGLVETSQNLGIMQCDENVLTIVFSLRSNRLSAMTWLEEKLRSLASILPSKVSVSGIYPPWEYLAKSKVRDTWCECYKRIIGNSPKIEAIHAGLECGIFSSGIKGLDCISVGPELLDIHTPNERLGISSTEKLWNILLETITKLD